MSRIACVSRSDTLRSNGQSGATAPERSVRVRITLSVCLRATKPSAPGAPTKAYVGDSVVGLSVVGLSVVGLSVVGLCKRKY